MALVREQVGIRCALTGRAQGELRSAKRPREALLPEAVPLPQFAIRNALLRVPPRDLLQPALDLVGRQPTSADHHACALLEVVEIRERVGVEEHEIGALADGDAAEA